MRYLSLLFIPLAVLLAFMACTPIIQVYTEEEPGVRLYKYRTYDWLSNPADFNENLPVSLNASTEKTVQNAVDTRMRTYGFKRCNTNPDLMIHAHIVVKNRTLAYQDFWCEDERWNQYGRCDRFRTVAYKEGTLILDMVDTQNGNQVWRGVAVGVLDNLNPDLVNSRIEQAVKEIFKQFPEQPVPGIVSAGK